MSESDMPNYTEMKEYLCDEESFTKEFYIRFCKNMSINDWIDWSDILKNIAEHIRDELEKKQEDMYKCECGATVEKTYKRIHINTQIHKKYVHLK